MERFQQQYIKAVVDQYDGKLQDAAKALGVHRSTLYRKMKENL
ncbi:MAG: helix-turn-helix domain-containing protein [Enterocloster sp.]